MKGILGDLGVMKIPLKPDAKPVKQRPYRLNPKYKAKVKEELDKMLAAGIIEPPEEGDLDHPIAFASKKLSSTKRNYITTEREGLAMVYALQKFRHYLLGG